MKKSYDLYGRASRVVVRLNETYSLSIIQGHGCCGNEQEGTVEVGIIHKDHGLISRPHSYINGKRLIEIMLKYSEED